MQPNAGHGVIQQNQTLDGKNKLKFSEVVQ